MDEIIRLGRDLAATIRELGMVRSQLVLERSEVWLQTSDLGVTERRETVSAAVAQTAIQVEELDAEVRALQVELDTAKFVAGFSQGFDNANFDR